MSNISDAYDKLQSVRPYKPSGDFYTTNPLEVSGQIAYSIRRYEEFQRLLGSITSQRQVDNTNVPHFASGEELIEREEMSLRRHGFDIPAPKGVLAEDPEEFRHTIARNGSAVIFAGMSPQTAEGYATALPSGQPDELGWE